MPARAMPFFWTAFRRRSPLSVQRREDADLLRQDAILDFDTSPACSPSFRHLSAQVTVASARRSAPSVPSAGCSVFICLSKTRSYSRRPAFPAMFRSQTEMKIFCGSAHRQLAQEICDCVGAPLGDATVSTFPDGETF